MRFCRYDSIFFMPLGGLRATPKGADKSTKFPPKIATPKMPLSVLSKIFPKNFFALFGVQTYINNLLTPPRKGDTATWGVTLWEGG